jgi:hypothetical protein
MLLSQSISEATRGDGQLNRFGLSRPSKTLPFQRQGFLFAIISRKP